MPKPENKSNEQAWAEHIHKGCAQCKRFDWDKPATLAFVCLRGLPWVKAIMERRGKSAEAEKRRADNAIYKYQMSEHGAQRVTKDRLKQLMRYK